MILFRCHRVGNENTLYTAITASGALCGEPATFPPRDRSHTITIVVLSPSVIANFPPVVTIIILLAGFAGTPAARCSVDSRVSF